MRLRQLFEDPIENEARVHEPGDSGSGADLSEAREIISSSLSTTRQVLSEDSAEVLRSAVQTSGQ